MRRRANGEGYIRRRADGRWEASLAWVDPITGRLQRKSLYARTSADVRAKLKNARERLDIGQPVKDAAVTVSAWLKRWRATTLAASNRRPTTREGYAILSRQHLEPAPFGAIRLDKLKPTHIDALILGLRAEVQPAGRVRRARAYADSTIRSVYTVLRQALDDAVRDGLLARNPAAAVQRPGVARREARYLTAGEVAAVLQAAEKSRYHTALVLIAGTGIRRGEALGLRWRYVDLDAGTLRVAGTLSRVGGKLVLSDEPKTARSRREVPLAPPVVVLLRKHKAAQNAERLRAGDRWQESGLVFTTELGGPVSPRNLLRAIEIAADTAGIDRVGVHTLRHSAAVALLEAGAHIKLVADLLGHSSINVTGDIYGHSSPAAARTAMDGLAGQLGL